MKKALFVLLMIGSLCAVAAVSAQGPEPLTAENAGEVVELARYGNGWVSDMGWSADGSKLVVGGSLGVWLFDYADLGAEPMHFSDADREVSAATISADGSLVAGTSAFGNLWVWDTADGSLVYQSEDAPFMLKGVAFSPDGSWLVYHSSATKTLVLDTSTWELVVELSVGGISDHLNMFFSPDASLLATVNSPGLTLWDTSTWEYVIDVPKVRDAVFNDDGSQMALGTADGIVMLYDPIAAEILSEYLVPSRTDKAVVQIDYLADGRVLAGFDRPFDNLFLWDGEPVSVAEGEETTVPEFLPALDARVWRMKFSPDHSSLLIIGDDHVMRVYDAPGEEPVAQYNFFNPGFVGADYDAATGLLAVANTLNQMMLWDTNTGERQIVSGSVNGKQDESDLVAITPDGSRIIARSGSSVNIIDAASGEVLHEIDAIGNDRDGLTASPGDFALSPDGSLLAVGSIMNQFSFWDVETGELILQPKSHTDEIEVIQFLGDGSRLMSVSQDGTVRLWGLPE